MPCSIQQHGTYFNRKNPRPSRPQAFDESSSHYAEENLPSGTNLNVGVKRAVHMHKYSINGYIYCGVPTLQATVAWKCVLRHGMRCVVFICRFAAEAAKSCTATCL